MRGGMDWPMRTSITAAATVACLAFVALIVGVPTLLQEVANMEAELAQERQEYLDISNIMWKELMLQGNEIQFSYSTNRQKRQYGTDIGQSDRKQGGSGSTSSGPKCQPGPKGSPGAPGEPGEPGMDGQSGIPGKGSGPEDSEYGSLINSFCQQCPAGPPGLPGYKGKRGLRGMKGEKGPKGSPGRDGEMGDDGMEGEIGYPGDMGAPGEIGTPGEDGVGYSKGAPGPKGEPGMIGVEGDEGLPGERGDDAPPGPVGNQGVVGRPGEPGKNGFPGQRGKAGGPGDDAEYCPCPPRSGLGTNPSGSDYGTGPAKPSYNPQTQYGGGSSYGSNPGPPFPPGTVPEEYRKHFNAAALRRHIL
uniref:Nematode cuticle collagen N-terminal domain-containing protein n=1 Tax=Panagrolaimus superbus TaxID=310955 RepID=A0A914Y8M8_9BILA